VRRLWAITFTIWAAVTFVVTLVLAYQEGYAGAFGLLPTAFLARCAWVLWHPGADAPAPRIAAPVGPERPWRAR
jgi:hypothetical protein